MRLYEHTHKKNISGSLEVICGSMFSGKTEELIRRIKRCQLANLACEIYKPIIDTRYSIDEIISHNKSSINAICIKKSSDIIKKTKNPDIIAIDEIQFFDKDIIPTCKRLANSGIRVIVSGLDMDFLGNPFGHVPELLSIAERITKIHAICIDCGNIANHSYRINNENQNIVELGASQNYKALCRDCFNKEINNV